MKNEIEHLIEGLTPRGAPAGLRDRVLAAVADELAAGHAVHRPPAHEPRWDTRIGVAVAASLVLGVALNVAAIRSDDARQARIFGPQPLPQAIRETVQMAQRVAGPECAELVQQQLTAAWQSQRQQNAQAFFRNYRQLLQLALTEQDRGQRTRRRSVFEKQTRAIRRHSCLRA